MSAERILITVKTYPTLSEKYGETVCTAGVRENGEWVRIYPVPFRRLGKKERYKLFDWIKCPLRRNTSDPRPESFRPVDLNSLYSVGHVGLTNKWRERRRIVLKTARVYDDLNEVISRAKKNEISLAVFKPTRVVDFVWKRDTRYWDKKRLERMRSFHRQLGLFEDNSWRKTFTVIPKLPFNFSYKFEDKNGKSSKLQVLEWQLGALYWNCLKQCDNDQAEALKKVKQKYFDEFIKKDLHFFLGTTQQYHFVAPNPWVIVGVFPIPHDDQLDLFDY